ncbi:MAG: glycosyltransferase, partial [Actinomycetota bacterium]|nr:glycosyltransferase [Actinomycetota bacterium]
ERCLDALVCNTIGAASLLVIDDASPDPRIGELLDRYRGLPGVEILRNQENLGYTRTINRGVDHARGDVVLLNSDTEVTPRWLQRLAEAAYADEGIGTVTAVSNNAGAFSVPDIEVDNPVPDAYSKDSVGRLVAQASERLRPATPTGNGFCLYVKRAVFEDIGVFDAESFPRGYGEENDFCVRALKRGWRSVIDDATFVFHAREASFGTEKSAIVPGARSRVSELHPEYDWLVRDFLASKDMKRVRARVRETFDSAAVDHPRARILFVVHEGGGGVAETSRDLVDGLRSSYDCLLLTSNTEQLKLWRGGGRGLDPVQSWRLGRAWHPTDFRREDYGAIAREVLTHWEIELVHVHHLFKHSFDVPRVAGDLEIPVVVSFHDYYLSCPTVHLLDERDRFCGGLCSPGSGRCRVPARQLEGVPPLKHDWVYRWRSEVAGMLETASAVVTTSPHTREVYRRSLPSLRDKRFEIIPHGRNLEQAGGPAFPPAGEGPVRILVPGNLAVHKGADYIHALRAEDRADRLEFHFLGDVPDEFADLGVRHGGYVRAEFGARVREIAPSFVGLFSITAETYNHTLTEAWAAGVPVLATAIGALAERVSAHGGGFLLPVDDPKAAYARIIEIVDEPEEYRRESERATAEDVPTVAAMASSYEALYESVRADSLSFSPRARETIPPRRRAGRMELAAFVPGEGGQYTGSTHV